MNSEEIKVTMGMDLGPLALGIRKGEQLLDKFQSSKAGNLFQEFFPLASIGGAVATLEKAISKARDVQRQAEEFGVSTSFIQDINNIGMLSGISEGKIEKMMGAFEKSLPVGSDVEEEFYRMADKIAGIQDPVSQAQAAIEAFGKSGYKMLPILQKGSEGIKALGNQFSKFSDEDISNLENAETRLKQLGTTLEVVFGKAFTYMGKALDTFIAGIQYGVMGGEGIIEGFNHALGENTDEDLDADEKAKARKQAEAIAKSQAEAASLKEAQDKFYKKQQEIRFKQASPDEQVGMFKQEQEFLQHQYEMESSEEKRLEIAGKILEVEEKIKEIQKKQAEEASKEVQKRFDKINSASTEWLRDKENLAKRNHPEFTLEDLAKSGQGHFEYWAVNRPGRFVSSQGVQQAREIEQLRDWAKQNAMSDDPNVQNLAKTQWKKADEMFDVLTKKFPFLKDPQQELKEHAKKSEAHLDRLLTLAQGDGINTNPAMGE